MVSDMGRDTQGTVCAWGMPSLVQAPGVVHQWPRVGCARPPVSAGPSAGVIFPQQRAPHSLQRARKIINGGRLCKHSLSPKLLEM